MPEKTTYSSLQRRSSDVQDEQNITASSNVRMDSGPKKSSAITETSAFLDINSKSKIIYPWLVRMPAVIVALFTLIALAFCSWIIVRVLKNGNGWTASSSIGNGGSFTQLQAKSLDLVSSVIIMPMIVGLFNYYCFQSARSCTVNEKSGRDHSLSLRALVEVSTTDWGSYSPFKLFALARTRQARVVLLAVLTLASAISFSALSNVVAYEAFYKEAGLSEHASIHRLYRAPSTVSPPGNQMPLLRTTNQTARFNSRWFQLLTTLSYKPADIFLDDNTYIGINMTNASLARLSPTTTNLLSVPAYRLSYDCTPASTSRKTISTPLTTMGAEDQLLRISIATSVNATFTRMFQGDIRNGASTILSADNGVYQFLAYEGLGLPSSSVILGNIGSFNSTKSFTITSFGNLSHFAFNNTLLDEGEGTKSVLSFWGVVCTVTRQSGTVDMHRQAHATEWYRSSFVPSPSPNDEPMPLNLITRDLQTNPQYVSPVGTIPGLGGALAASSNISDAIGNWSTEGSFDGDSNPLYYEDFETWVRNFLYAEGEARRIAYEIALQVPLTNSTAEKKEHESLQYDVVAKSDVLRYRMIFVPWILLVALLALVLLGLLVLYLEGSLEMDVRDRRVLTPLRIVLDSGAGLEAKAFKDKEEWEETDVDEWARTLKVKYVNVNGPNEKRIIRLKVE